MKKLRWGILGVAKINERLMPGFMASANAELRAIASRSLDKARKAAAAAKIPVAHGSYEALLDDPNIDAVYIPLPNHLHAEWTMKAAERGKHVLCEKPLAPSAAEGERLAEFCAKRNVYLMDGFMWPHHPRTARLRAFLNDGGIGAIRRASGAFTFRMEKLDPANIRLQPATGGGSLLDIGCYPIYAIRWAFQQEPLKVYATARYHSGVDVEMNGLLWMPDGCMASFDCGFTLPYRGGVQIVGTEGYVRVPNMWLPPRRASYEIYREGRWMEEAIVEGEEQIVHMIENFGRAVLEKRPLQPPLTEALKTLKVMDALALSAREERVVAL